MKKNEAFERWATNIGYSIRKGRGDIDAIYASETTELRSEGWQASHTHILALLDSPEMVEDIAGAIRCVDLYGEHDPHEYLEGSQRIAKAAIAAIKERISHDQ